jgi:hypothetical protein
MSGCLRLGGMTDRAEAGINSRGCGVFHSDTQNAVSNMNEVTGTHVHTVSRREYVSLIKGPLWFVLKNVLEIILRNSFLMRI